MKEEIELNNVRLSYPHLYKHSQYEGRSTGKYATDLILHKQKHEKEIQMIHESIERLCKKAGVLKENLKRLCLKDGDNLIDKDGNPKNKPETDNCYIISARNERQPMLVNKDAKSPIIESQNLLLGGATVKAFITLFSYGEGVNTGISAIIDCVQLADESTIFGTEPFNPEGKLKPIGSEDVKNIFG
jgi:hypothetical protein